jgi:hypothetical protein
MWSPSTFCHWVKGIGIASEFGIRRKLPARLDLWSGVYWTFLSAAVMKTMKWDSVASQNMLKRDALGEYPRSSGISASTPIDTNLGWLFVMVTMAM